MKYGWFFRGLGLLIAVGFLQSECLSAQRSIDYPAEDAGVKTIKELTRASTKDEIIAYSEKWKPYRSLATYFLWHYYLSKRKRSSVSQEPESLVIGVGIFNFP